MNRPKTLPAAPWLRSLASASAAVALLGAALGGCAPLLVGGAAVGGAMVATDRRTSGTQLEDQGIELKAGPRIRDAIGERGHINVTSFNRTVLLTGEVPTENDRSAAGTAISRIDNVRGVINELAVTPNVPFSERSNDALITSKVKASFIDSRDIFASAYKVVTEHGVVYLMGMVTEREANRAVEQARTVSGVRKVVKAFDIISEDELARRVPAAPSAAASAP